jgi:hypothetical protein
LCHSRESGNPVGITCNTTDSRYKPSLSTLMIHKGNWTWHSGMTDYLLRACTWTKNTTFIFIQKFSYYSEKDRKYFGFENTEIIRKRTSEQNGSKPKRNLFKNAIGSTLHFPHSITPRFCFIVG